MKEEYFMFDLDRMISAEGREKTCLKEIHDWHISKGKIPIYLTSCSDSIYDDIQEWVREWFGYVEGSVILTSSDHDKNTKDPDYVKARVLTEYMDFLKIPYNRAARKKEIQKYSE